jgi:hypothetical protein
VNAHQGTIYAHGGRYYWVGSSWVPCAHECRTNGGPSTHDLHRSTTYLPVQAPACAIITVLTQSQVHVVVHAFTTCALVRPSLHSLARSLGYVFTRSLTHSSDGPPPDSFTHSLVHGLSRSIAHLLASPCRVLQHELGSVWIQQQQHQRLLVRHTRQQQLESRIVRRPPPCHTEGRTILAGNCLLPSSVPFARLKVPHLHPPPPPPHHRGWTALAGRAPSLYPARSDGIGTCNPLTLIPTCITGGNPNVTTWRLTSLVFSAHPITRLYSHPLTITRLYSHPLTITRLYSHPLTHASTFELAHASTFELAHASS